MDSELRTVPEIPLTTPMKDCFGTVISSLKKMKECVTCELLVECRSMNWQDGEPGGARVTPGRPGERGRGGSPATGGATTS